MFRGVRDGSVLTFLCSLTISPGLTASATALISLDYPACPASLDILEVSMPPAVKLAAVFSVPPTLNPDIITAEIDSFVPIRSPIRASRPCRPLPRSPIDSPSPEVICCPHRLGRPSRSSPRLDCRRPSAFAEGYGVTSQAALAQFAEIASDLNASCNYYETQESVNKLADRYLRGIA